MDSHVEPDLHSFGEGKQLPSRHQPSLLLAIKHERDTKIGVAKLSVDANGYCSTSGATYDPQYNDWEIYDRRAKPVDG